MKIRKIILLCSLVFTSFAMPVFASEAKEPYFTTYMGVELTEEEYNNLARGFDFDTIDTMPQEMINKFKNIEDLKRIEKTVYVVTESFYTPTGTLIGNIEKQYTEKEYQQLLKNNEYSLMDNSGSSGSSTHTTSSKKITISVNGYSETAVSATIRNELE